MASVAETETVPQWTLGHRLRRAREFGGVTPQQMAAVLEVSERTVRNYEHNKTPIKNKDVKLYAEACHVPYEWLIGDPDTQEYAPPCVYQWADDPVTQIFTPTRTVALLGA